MLTIEMSEIVVYEEQLERIQSELRSCIDDDKRNDLQQLERNMRELIALTKESSVTVDEEAADALDDEYALFRAELSLDEKTEADVASFDDVKEEIEALSGSKCQAPFKHAWCDEPVLHNALVFKVEEVENLQSADDILIRVMFTNPTHVEMKPCPYFLEGDCKFDSQQCRFSHGELVPFNSIREFKEPNFSSMAERSRVLVKETDGIWRRAIVINVSDEKCQVKLESNGTLVDTTLENIFPLDCDNEDSSSSDDELSDHHTLAPDNVASPSVMDILQKMPSSTMLGSWEQYTKGFGSKIMSKMGYIHGSGLGVNRDGRVEPVPAVIYPTGKSLDHCMLLKEKAGNDKDLFRADKKMRITQRKHEQAMSRAYEKEKQRTDVFSFLNKRLGQTETEQAQTAITSHKILQSTSKKGLSIGSFQIAEEIKKTEKESKKLKESLGRHSVSSPLYSVLKDKIQECNNRLKQLESSEQKISTEMQQRNDKKKLSIF